MFTGACALDPAGHAMMTGHEIKSRHDYEQRQAAENPFPQYVDPSPGSVQFLVSLGHRIAFLDPVRPEVV